MTPEELVTKIMGEWDESMLPSLYDFIIQWHDDARRYYVIRDFAKKLTFMDNPRERSELSQFDDIVDAKLYDSHEDYT